MDGELVNKLANLLSRGQLLARPELGNQLGVSANDAVPILREIRGAAEEIAAAYDSRNFAATVQLICAFGGSKRTSMWRIRQPWKMMIKTDVESAWGADGGAGGGADSDAVI